MTTIRIDFENTNHLKEWILALDVWLRENNLTNSPRQPRSVFWRSNRGYSIHYPLANDSIFYRFPDFSSGVTLTMTDVEGDSKFELSVGQKPPLETYLDPNTGFLALMNILKDIPFMERQLECGTLVKDLLPSPIRFAIANMPTYVSAMVEDLLLQREDEINDRMQKQYMRHNTFSTKERLLDFFSSYGILAYVLNHVHWDDIGLAPLLKPIYAHWKGQGLSSNPQPLSPSSDYVATSGTITLGNSEPTTITTPAPNGRGSITRWIRTSQGVELDPQSMSGSVCSNYPNLPLMELHPDFDPLP